MKKVFFVPLVAAILVHVHCSNGPFSTANSPFNKQQTQYVRDYLVSEFRRFFGPYAIDPDLMSNQELLYHVAYGNMQEQEILARSNDIDIENEATDEFMYPETYFSLPPRPNSGVTPEWLVAFFLFITLVLVAACNQ